MDAVAEILELATNVDTPFPKYCRVYDTSALPAIAKVRAWAKKCREPAQFVALEETGGFLLTISTDDGEVFRYGTPSRWLDGTYEEKHAPEYLGVRLHTKQIERKLSKMFKAHECTGIKSLTVYGEFFGTGVSSPLIKGRDLNILDILITDEIGPGLVSHATLVSECERYGLRAAENLFPHGTLDELLKHNLSKCVHSVIAKDMTAHGFFIKPMVSRSRDVPVLRRVSLFCTAFPLAAKFTSKQHEQVSKILPLITSKRVYEIMSHLKLDADHKELEVRKMASAVIADGIDETMRRFGIEMFEKIGKDQQQQVYEYLIHYAESIVRPVFVAVGVAFVE